MIVSASQVARLLASKGTWLAQLSPDCSTAPASLACKLDQALNALQWMAASLALPLAAVAVAAWVIYRRNKHSRLNPHD